MIEKEENLFCGQELETCCLKASHHLPAVSCVLGAGRKCNNEKSVSKNLSLTCYVDPRPPSIQFKWQMVSHLWRNPHCNQLGDESCTLHQVNNGVKVCTPEAVHDQR